MRQGIAFSHIANARSAQRILGFKAQEYKCLTEISPLYRETNLKEGSETCQT